MKDVIEFFKIKAQLEGLHVEVDKLSKKKPDDAVNKFKLKFINEILLKANAILDNEYLPFDDFRIFDEDEVSSNSDVVLVLFQYIKSFESERVDKKLDLMNI